MGWQPVIEYVEVEPALPAPVKKQVWDGEKFVSMTLHRHRGVPNGEKLLWLEKTYGHVYRIMARLSEQNETFWRLLCSGRR